MKFSVKLMDFYFFIYVVGDCCFFKCRCDDFICVNVVCVDEVVVMVFDFFGF